MANIEYDRVARKEGLQQRRAKYRFDDAFTTAVRKAYKRDTKDLCDLLRSEGHLLSEENLALLTDLIARTLQIKGKGRPPGSSFMSPQAEWEDRIARAVLRELTALRAHNGGKRLPPGQVEQVIQKHCDRVGAALDGDLPDISIENIRNAVKRGIKRKPGSA